MENIDRIDGFIDLEQLYKKQECHNILWRKEYQLREILKVSKIRKVFLYQQTIWFFKELENRDDYCSEVESREACYNELVAEELAKEFHIPCAYYDLAQYHGRKGVITKDFRIKNANYILGETVLDNYIRDVLKTEKGTRKYNHYLESYNSLEEIWNALDDYLKDQEEREEIVKDLMEKIVNLYLFDMLVRNTDRHECNWGIIEENHHFTVQPTYDHERFLQMDDNIRLNVHTDSFCGISFDEVNSDLDKLIEFLNVSERKYLDEVKRKKLLIEEQNLIQIFERVEQKIGIPLPIEYKLKILESFEEYRTLLDERLEAYENTRINKDKNTDFPKKIKYDIL